MTRDPRGVAPEKVLLDPPRSLPRRVKLGKVNIACECLPFDSLGSLRVTIPIGPSIVLRTGGMTICFVGVTRIPVPWCVANRKREKRGT